MSRQRQSGFSRESYMVWAMWALASLFYAYQYILRVLPNIMMDQIQDRFQIDAALFGQYSGLYYIGYAGVHIPIGILLDRLGPRDVMSSCILLTVVGMMSLIYTDVWIYPLVGRFLIGIGSSAAILGVFKVIRLAFPEDRFVRMLGFSVAIGLVGAIYGGQPVSFLMSFMGWEKVIEIICVAGILLAVAVYAIIPPYDPPKRKNNSARNDMTTVLSNGKVLFICLLGGLMIGPLEGFADAWGTGYLKAAYTQLSTATAAYLPSFIFLGMCFGSPILSLVAEKTQAYYRLIIVSACVMGVVFMYMLLGYASEESLSLLFPMVGLFCAYQILVIYKASMCVPERLVGLTTAIANMIMMAFGYLFHSSIGLVMSATWGGQMIHGRPLYDAQSFTMGLSIIPITLIMAAIGFYHLHRQESKSL